MNKQAFLKQLEERLKVLEDNERKDIINEYSDIIEEKIKHGKSEADAIADFGNIDLLVKEILSAYKINPNYDKKSDKNNSTSREIVNDLESLIKKIAKSLSNFTNNIVNDFKNSKNNLTIELIFEIIIKVILLLIGFALLRLPFAFIDHLGLSIIDMAFFPIDHVIQSIWSLFVGICYIVTCILIGIIVFRKYFNNPDTSEKIEIKKEKIVKKNEDISISKEKNIKQEKIKKEYKKETTSSTIGEIVMMFVKIGVIVFVLIPFALSNIGITFALITALIFLFKGLHIIGLVILLIGLVIVSWHIFSIILNITFNQKRIHFYPFVIGIVFIIIGGIVFIESLMSYNYYNTAPKNGISIDQKVITETISKKTNIEINNGKKTIVINDSLKDNEIIIEVNYYDDLINIDRTDYEKDGNNQERFINIYTVSDDDGFSAGKKVYNLLINDLKNKKVYNYNKLFELDVKVYVNSKTSHLVQ